jgi:polyisoprenoid-binding protein YceI
MIKMKNIILILIATSITNLQGQTKILNLNLSEIKWVGKEITTKTHFGSLNFKKGNISIDKDLITAGEFIVDMKSLKNEDLSGGSKDYLEKHLRSDDFFGVEQHPTASLKITSVKKVEGENHLVVGDLKIKGITNQVIFDIILNEKGATAELIFDRSKYGVKFRSSSFFDELGDKLIYDDIELKVNLVF